MSRGEAESVAKLEVFPWEIFPDMAVFDWLIRLRDKDRSGSFCDHVYLFMQKYAIVRKSSRKYSLHLPISLSLPLWTGPAVSNICFLNLLNMRFIVFLRVFSISNILI